MPPWAFAATIPADRRSRLEGPPPFTEIAQQVARTMQVICTHSDRCDEAVGYVRLVCCVSVPPDLFDLFFNSKSGYRGKYFSSPESGLRANAELLGLVTDQLALHTTHADISLAQAKASFQAPSAKCWLAEVGKGFCKLCEGEWSSPQDDLAEILNGRWDNRPEAKARYGRKAPRFTKLRMLGAFVDTSGREYIATQKRDRAQQLHDFGWS